MDCDADRASGVVKIDNHSLVVMVFGQWFSSLGSYAACHTKVLIVQRHHIVECTAPTHGKINDNIQVVDKYCSGLRFPLALPHIGISRGYSACAGTDNRARACHL